jgi:hypothetical protein
MPPFPGMPLPQKPSSGSAVEPQVDLSQPQEAENSILPPSATNPVGTEPAITIDTPDDKLSTPNQNA